MEEITSQPGKKEVHVIGSESEDTEPEKISNALPPATTKGKKAYVEDVDEEEDESSEAELGKNIYTINTLY